MSGTPTGNIRVVKLAVALVCLSALLAGGAAAATRTAHVTLVSNSPASVLGTGFRATERVTLTVSATETRTKRVTAGARGNFRTTFAGFSVKFCVPYTLQARGSRGSRAFVKIVPECAPQRQPG